ncbi:hypothetical protein ASC77_07915 [Nocardioides sp. Root1257]|uniref:endonuclease/exonuclease/phosphatase family protein n=1 Tax=unclassified Nocardioides TaxID=2615069 RepID=UPI0006FE95BF|nr:MULTISPECIES: endonuclease/exonuclease/phosphatase family protein [unclassified Nocardioides]KQW48656.1 hypothetical protein ASC77_07915 [Nocardioides sp. Root1257]KRC47831.1 hypothetical protein ASE24_07920 [Nocardioides sp. Root224]
MRRLAAALALLVVAGLPAAPAAARADDPLRVGSFNIDKGQPLAPWKRKVHALRAEVDVAGLQEVSTAAKRRFLVASPGWGVFGATPGPDQNPVIWDGTVFRRAGAQAVRIAGKQGRFPAAYATVVRLVHRTTGQRYSVLNVHLVYGAVADGRRIPGQAARYRYYVAEVRGLARAVAREQRRTGTTVLVVGDFNDDHVGDREVRNADLPVVRLGARDLVSAWDSADVLREDGGTSTVGAGYIDNVWAEREALSVRALAMSGGQHHPVVATYDVAPDPTVVQRHAE